MIVVGGQAPITTLAFSQPVDKEGDWYNWWRSVLANLPMKQMKTAQKNDQYGAKERRQMILDTQKKFPTKPVGPAHSQDNHDINPHWGECPLLATGNRAERGRAMEWELHTCVHTYIYIQCAK